MKRSLIILLLTTILFFTGCNVDGPLTGTILEPTSIDDQQSYIADLKIAGAYWKRYSKSAEGKLNSKYSNEENNYSYQIVETFDLNRGCGSTSDCNFLYESRTYDKSKAITNITVRTYTAEQFSTTFDDEYGNTYYAVAGLRINGLNSSTSYFDAFDINKGAGGKVIYLYITYGTVLYEPITSIDIAAGAYDTLEDYQYICSSESTSSTLFQNLNEGNDGDQVFIGISRAITGWEIYNLNLVDYDVDGNMQTKTIVLDTKEKKMKEEYLKPFVDKGDSANFVGYSYGNEVVNVGDDIDHNNITIYAKWTYNITLDMSFFDQEDITYNNVNFTGDLPTLTYNGYNTVGWKFKDAENEISTGLPLKHGGVLEPVLERVHVSDYNEFVSGYELGCLFDEDYNLYTLYSLMKRPGYTNVFKELGFRCALYRLNIEIVNGFFETATTIPTTVSSTIDYSTLDEEQIKYIAMHAKFLMMCSDDAIEETITYFENEGKSESIIDEVILDLCDKEIERRK